MAIQHIFELIKRSPSHKQGSALLYYKNVRRLVVAVHKHNFVFSIACNCFITRYFTMCARELRVIPYFMLIFFFFLRDEWREISATTRESRVLYILVAHSPLTLLCSPCSFNCALYNPTATDQFLSNWKRLS